MLPVDSIVFDLQRTELEPLHWGFEIHADGSGRYFASGAPTAANPSGNVWQEVHVGRATLELLMAGAHREGACETRARHVANTGAKTLSYVHGNAWFTCTFNYSDSDAVMKTASTFIAMQETMRFGEQLAHDHRFDRLSLDAEMTALEEESRSGHVLELGNIAPVLRSIAEDDRVIDRVRRKAARLAESAEEASR